MEVQVLVSMPGMLAQREKRYTRAGWQISEASIMNNFDSITDY